MNRILASVLTITLFVSQVYGQENKPKTSSILQDVKTQEFPTIVVKPKKFTILLEVDFTVTDSSGNVVDGLKVLGRDGKPLNSIIIESSGNVPVPIPPGPIPPVPTPTPTPTPAFPAGQYGLAKKSYDFAISNVPPEGRTKSVSLSKSWSDVADRISQSASKQAAGVPLTNEDLALDLQSIFKAVKVSNTTVLGNVASTWQQWDKLIGDEIYNLYQSKKIVLPSDFETAFREISLGLQSVK